MGATTHFHFREDWRELKRGRPGRRFQDRYERARREDKECGAGQRIVMLIAGIVSLAIGALLVVFPGPAIPFLFIGGGFLATESRVIARFMDWSEVRLRLLFRWGKGHWRKLPAVARVLLLMLAACCSAATMYFSYRLMRG